MKCKSSEEGGKVIDVLCHPKILLICDIERGEERACVGAEATKEKRTMVPHLLSLLHPTALASLFATFGRVLVELVEQSPIVSQSEL